MSIFPQEPFRLFKVSGHAARRTTAIRIARSLYKRVSRGYPILQVEPSLNAVDTRASSFRFTISGNGTARSGEPNQNLNAGRMNSEDIVRLSCFAWLGRFCVLRCVRSHEAVSVRFAKKMPSYWLYTIRAGRAHKLQEPV